MTVATETNGVARLEQGRRVFSRGIKALLVRNDLSHSELKLLSHWANPTTPSWLSTSQISYLRTGRLRSIGPRTLDAMGQLNLHLAALAGNDSPDVVKLQPLQPLPNSLKDRLASPFFLRHPDTGLAMNAGDMALVWLGRLRPAELSDASVSRREAQRISEGLSLWLQQWCADNGLLLNQGMPQILADYPSSERSRLERLKAVAAGLTVFEPEQLNEEAEALRVLLERLNGGSLPTNAPLLSALIGDRD